MRQLERGPPLYHWYFMRKWRGSLKRKRQLFPEVHAISDEILKRNMRGLTQWLVNAHTEWQDEEQYFDGYAVSGQRLADAGIPVRRSQVTTTLRTDVRAGDEGVEVWFAGVRLHTFRGPDALMRADEAATSLNAFFDQTPRLFEVDANPEFEISPGIGEGAAGSLYYTAPVVLIDGKERIAGEVVLRRVNDVPGATAEDLRWHIESHTLEF